MARRTLILVSLLLVLLFTVLFLKARDTANLAQLRARPPASAAGNVTIPQLPVAEPLPSVQGLTTNTEAIRRDLQREIQTLEAQLAERRRVLQDRASALAQVREQAAAAAEERELTSTNEPPANASTLEARGEELRALSADLNEMRETSEALRQDEENAIMLRENANRLALAQIDAQLVQAEEAKSATQSQLDRWSRDNAFVNSEVARNPALEATLTQQQEQIEALRQLRLAVIEEMHQQTNAIFDLSQQARNQLRSEEQNVRNQIFSLQNEIRRIQRTQVQGQRSAQSQTAQLQQAQRALQTESTQVRRLESSLQSKQSELRRLQ